MDKKIKRVINLNILCYINNFSYIYVSNMIEIENSLALWGLSPFVFLFFTSFILENKYHSEHLYLKKIAHTDFFIKFIGACCAFTELGLSFNVKVLLSIFFMILNFIIEIIMLKIKPKKESEIKKYIVKDYIDKKEAGKGSEVHPIK